MPGIGEVIGGAQREERLDQLVENMRSRHRAETGRVLVEDSICAASGTVPHAGFGFGLRATDHVPDRRQQHPRRDPLRAHPGQRGVLRGGKRAGVRRAGLNGELRATSGSPAPQLMSR